VLTPEELRTSSPTTDLTPQDRSLSLEQSAVEPGSGNFTSRPPSGKASLEDLAIGAVHEMVLPR
jgi:hypothetical protein